ncbi:vitamin B12 dependent-methionine synthase activation domain-containing protein [Eubacteriales bacterium KG127]
MKAKLNKINENEVLKYLGYRAGEIDDKLIQDIERISLEIMDFSRPALTFRVFNTDRESNIALENTDFFPGGKDILEMLLDCDKCIVMAATLGLEIEKKLRARQVINIYESVIMDACASSAIENICDNFCDEFEKLAEKDGKFLTDRFSPGYGDFPFEQQKDICHLLMTEKKIGVSLSKSGIMIPRKSVTAIIGISNIKQTKRFRGCEHCNMFRNCTYRKSGLHCGPK